MLSDGKVLQNKLQAVAQNGQISCAEAMALAEGEAVSTIEVGQAADAAGIKIVTCQLGCFKKNWRQRMASK
jgi:hypothetical protein